MEHHTFICGTSKSKKRDAYYIRHNNRFWGTLQESGLTQTQIDPEEYRRLGKEYGIYLTEIVDPDEYRIARDSDIEPHQVRGGINTLIARIKTHDPNRIAFVGKNAATWFYRYCEDKGITHSQEYGHTQDRAELDEGELNWAYQGLDYFLLSNTHRHWDKEIWLDFWRKCEEDVNQFRSSF